MTSAPTKSDKVKAVSKRQARKHGLNPNNTWQQQPKIKSMAAREKAYLRNAGFTTSQKVKNKDSINPQVDFINSPEYKFGRLLASPIARTRHATILKLKEYLKARTDPSNENGGLSVLDLMKLWKGMWHTLYLCDGAVVQEEVSKVLAELIWSVGGNQEEDEYAGRVYLEMEEDIMGEYGNDDDDEKGFEQDDDDDDDDDVSNDDEMQIIEMEDSDDDSNEKHSSSSDDDNSDGNEEEEDTTEEGDGHPAQDENIKHCRGAHLSALYVRAFFRTLTREWSNMDKYRIDKFYTLVRFILREIYRYMAARHWNLGIIRLFNDAIFEEVLRTNKYGNGVRFHILDITLEELAKVNSEESTGLTLTEATFLDALEPYFALAQRVDDKMVHQRVMDKVLLKFLDEYSVVSQNFDESDEKDAALEDAKKLVMDQVHVGTVGQFIFELASDTETAERYRKALYDMHKTYMKRIKAVGRDVSLAEEEDVEGEQEQDEKDASDHKECSQDHSHETCQEKEESTAIPELEAEKKKSKKKKKKKSKVTEHVIQKVDVEEEIVQVKKKQKSNTDVSIIQNNVTKTKETLPPPSKKETLPPPTKKEKKAQKAVTLTKEEEEVITISKKEQKAAAQAVLKAAKAAKAKEQQQKQQQQQKKKEEEERRLKKVKFGTMNQSKSYKASMKDLKKVDPKAILEKTPEKSILLKTDQKKKRKR